MNENNQNHSNFNEEQQQQQQTVSSQEQINQYKYAQNKIRISGLAIAGLVVGIVAIVGSWIPLLNFVSVWFAIVGIGLSIPALIITIKGTKGGKGIAIAGLVLGVVTIIIFIIMYAGAAALSDNVSNDSTTSKDSAKTEEPASNEDSSVIIVDAALGRDYEGKTTIVVNYEWTNTTDETTSLMLTYTIKAYQNGVELEGSIFADDWLSDKEDTSGWVDMSKDVKPGATIKTSAAYVLSDESAPVDIEVSDLWNWDDDLVATQTFNIK
jgi:hypothetical protein